MAETFRRTAATLLAVLLAALSISDYRAWSRERDRLSDYLGVTGVAQRRPGVMEDLSRESDPGRARLRAARALLADEMDRTWRDRLPRPASEAADRLGFEKLRTAGELAESALRSRPGAWQAHLVRGGATYLELLRRGDSAPAARPELWLRPLERARQLAPGQPEPLRLLAAAHLSDWSRLDPGRRPELVALLTDAFRDPDTFDLLIPAWLRLAPSLTLAFEPVPERSGAWRRVRDHFARGEDWERYCAAQVRRERALRAELGERLEAAAARLRGGERTEARKLLLTLLSDAPASSEFAPLAGRALELLDPRPAGPPYVARLRDWLDWSLERCLFAECPFGTAAQRRLNGLVEGQRPARLALAAAAAGEESRGVLLERRAGAGEAEEWAPFHLLRARRSVAGGQRGTASHSLEKVHPSWRERALFRSIEASTAGSAAGGAAGGESWPVEAWEESPALWRLELLAGRPAAGLVIEMDKVHSRGAAVELRWDGAIAGCYPVAQGETLRVPLAVSEGLHLLEVRRLIGRYATPGAARLQPRRAVSGSAPRPPLRPGRRG